MEQVGIIGIDLAKRSFQVHGARADGSVACRRKLGRGKLLSSLASQPGCTVVMEACASAHYWGREIAALGHEVRLVPPIYVKPSQGRARIGQLAGVLEDGDCGLPEAVVELGRLLLGRIDELDGKIDGLDSELRASARENEETARLMTIPGVGPVTAMALQSGRLRLRGVRGRAGKARRKVNSRAIRPRSNAERSFGEMKCIL